MIWHFKIAVDNRAAAPFAAEHGLAVYCSSDSGREVLFDTGASADSLLRNLALLGVEPHKIPAVVLSHGHNDHTGGISPEFANAVFYAAPGITSPHYSRHPGKPPRCITMPPEAQQILASAALCTVKRFTPIMPEVYLTGPIPRLSGEDTGGPFFTAEVGGICDDISDEQAIFFAGAETLLQGCCHAGIINTMELCRRELPQCRIRRIIGGLHLLHASEKRLKETAEYLAASGVEELYLMHCTGENAIEFLRREVPQIAIFTPTAGDVI